MGGPTSNRNQRRWTLSCRCFYVEAQRRCQNDPAIARVRPTFISRPVERSKVLPSRHPTMSQPISKREAARQVVDVLLEISALLVSALNSSQPSSLPHLRAPFAPDGWLTCLKSTQNTHLDHKQLSLCVSLIENGVNPDALAVGCFPSRRAQGLSERIPALRMSFGLFEAMVGISRVAVLWWGVTSRDNQSGGFH